MSASELYCWLATVKINKEGQKKQKTYPWQGVRHFLFPLWVFTFENVDLIYNSTLSNQERVREKCDLWRCFLFCRNSQNTSSFAFNACSRKVLHYSIGVNQMWTFELISMNNCALWWTPDMVISSIIEKKFDIYGSLCLSVCIVPTNY